MIRTFFLLVLCSLTLSANTIIFNAKVYTLNDKQKWAEALVIEDDKIVFVGATSKALTYKREKSLLIDAKEHFVMPGFIDAHTHTAIAALLENLGISLVGAKGKKEILQRLRDYKEQYPNKTIYAGVGFYPYAFGPNGPTKELLDEIFPDRYAFFISNNGHQAWANSKTLDYLGITKESLDPLKGMQYYQRDKAGEPTGFLVEGEAVWPHFAKLSFANSDSFFKALEPFFPKLSKQGITTLFDAGVLGGQEEAYKALQALAIGKKLPLEYHASYFVANRDQAKESAQKLALLQKQFEQKKFKISSIKFINDNSDDDNFGITFSEDALFTYMSAIFKANANVMIHTSQDRSTHQALNAIEKAKKLFPHTQSRVSLAHVNMVRDSDFRRFSDLDVTANIQTFNAVGGGYYEYRYMLYEDAWQDKLARFRHFFDSGVMVSASSDYPVCGSLKVCSPFYGIEIGMTRQKVGAGRGSDVLASKKECLSLEQSLRAYTLNAAYQLGREKYIGSLEVGKDADVIILDQNPFNVSAYDLHKMEVIRTFSKGKTVYQRERNDYE